MTEGVRAFQEVGIVGFGLMGGSLARDLKSLPRRPRVRALSRDPLDLEAGLASGVLDEAYLTAEHGSAPRAFLESLDLLIYAAPLQATLDLLAEHAPLLDTSTVVTDVASLKAPVLERAQELGILARFVGGHPMVGDARSGFQSSRAGLFRSARVWIVADSPNDAVVARIREFWGELGARTVLVDAARHDAQMAWVSHLPQLLANALALSLEGAGFQPADLGRGGRDMTRLAGSSPEMWQDLMMHAPPELMDAMADLETSLSKLRLLLEEGRAKDVAKLMEMTRSWVGREAWS